MHCHQLLKPIKFLMFIVQVCHQFANKLKKGLGIHSMGAMSKTPIYFGRNVQWKT